MLEITGGILKGRKIMTTPRSITRYTPNMVRKAIFDAINIENKSLLDICSGSGVISMEALSRGASEVIGIDSSYKSIKTIKENLKSLNINERIKVYGKDFRIKIPQLLKNGYKFDYIFADPPFDRNYICHIFDVLCRNVVLRDDGALIIESSPKESSEIDKNLHDIFEITNKKKYGNVIITFLKLMP